MTAAPGYFKLEISRLKDLVCEARPSVDVLAPTPSSTLPHRNAASNGARRRIRDPYLAVEAPIPVPDGPPDAVHARGPEPEVVWHSRRVIPDRMPSEAAASGAGIQSVMPVAGAARSSTAWNGFRTGSPALRAARLPQ